MMKITRVLLILACWSLAQFACHAETITLVASNAANEVGESQTITVENGETIELVGSSYKFNGPTAVYTIGDKAFVESVLSSNSSLPAPPLPELKRFKIVGPATLKIATNSSSAGSTWATFEVTRIGTPTLPAAIPAEAGSNFSVIFESSSDLVNWQPAVAGTYSGNEVHRFFRIRIVKQAP